MILSLSLWFPLSARSISVDSSISYPHFLWNVSRETAAARNLWRTSQIALSIPIYTKRTVNIQPAQQAASIPLHPWESCQHDLLTIREQIKHRHMLNWNRPHSNIIPTQWQRVSPQTDGPWVVFKLSRFFLIFWRKCLCKTHHMMLRPLLRQGCLPTHHSFTPWHSSKETFATRYVIVRVRAFEKS